MSDRRTPPYSLAKLSSGSSLEEFQEYVRAVEISRGFNDQSTLEKCLLLGEEVGELFKAVRKHHGLGVDQQSEVGIIEDELADVLIYLCAIANRAGVDLGSAFINKEKKNKTRVWKVHNKN